MLRENGVDSPARRASVLVGPESPLRPATLGSKPSVDFVDALGRLSQTFQQLRGALGEIDQKIDGLTGGLGKANTKLDVVQDRLDVSNARMMAFEARLTVLEERQADDAGVFHRRLGEVGRQVGFAVGIALMLAVLTTVALVVIR